MNEDVEILKAALAKGPTPGPEYWCPDHYPERISTEAIRDIDQLFPTADSYLEVAFTRGQISEQYKQFDRIAGSVEMCEAYEGALVSLLNHSAEAHYEDCAYICNEDEDCNCGSGPAREKAKAILSKYKGGAG